MTMLIKDGKACPDPWIMMNDADDGGALQTMPGKKLIVPLKFWRDHPEEIAEYDGEIAVWLNSDESVNDIGGKLHDLPLVALNFPVFTDGRSYTNARELRRELAYKGEIRAVGDVLRDQLFYMSRCGFNAFKLRDDQDMEACLAAFADFNTTYTATVLEPTPLFRRR